MTEAPQGLKDAALSLYYERMFGMHGTPGWRELEQDVDAMIADYNRVDMIDEQHSVEFRRGQLDILRWLRAHRETMEQAFVELLKADAGDESVVESTGGVAKMVRPGEEEPF